MGCTRRETIGGALVTFHIVGLDLSLTATGIARIRPEEVLLRDGIHVRTVTSKPVPDAKYPNTLARIRKLAGDIVRAALEDADDGDDIVFMIEGPAFSATTGQVHTRAGLWWLVYHLVEKRGLVIIIEPTKLKKYVTRKGNAPKDAVLSTVVRNFPHVAVMDNNEADALALACMAARELGFPQEPSVQRCDPSALEGVDWPEQFTQRRNHIG